MVPPDEVISRLLASADRMYSAGVGATAALMREADSLLARRLGRAMRGMGEATTYTAASAQVYRAQIAIVQEYIGRRLVGLTHAQAVKAAAVSIDSAVGLIHRLDKAFTGFAQPIRLDEALVKDATLRGVNASALRRAETSVERYGQAMIGKFETNLRVGLVTGMGQAEVISRLVTDAKAAGITARTLHAAEPAWFPEPTSYVRERYWAERIVRTETAHAANATNMAAIQETDGMGKKILAHFDRRTAMDSVAVHGQIRQPDEYFMDGAGRQYLHPPARPNDRETVIPWRVSWPETKMTRPRSPEAVAKAQIESLPKSRRPEGPARKQQIAASQATARADRKKKSAQSRGNHAGL